MAVRSFFRLFLPLIAAAGVLSAAGRVIPIIQAQNPEDALRLGQSYASQGQWKEAEEQLRLYRQAHPESPEAAVLHARSLVHLNQPFDALLELEELLQAAPDAVPALKLYAALLNQVVQDGISAEKVLLKCAQLAPRDPEVWKALGDFYVARGRSREALPAYERALRLAPTDAVLSAALGYAYGEANQPERAAPHFSRALSYNKRSTKPNPIIHLLYAEFLRGQNRLAESVPMYTRALLIEPHSADEYYGRASAYEKLKDFKHAEADARAAIREGGNRKGTYLLLMRVYKQQNNSPKVEEYAALVQKTKAEEDAQQDLANFVLSSLRTAEPLLRQGNFTEAAKHYEDIVRQVPTFYEAYFALGVCYSQTGRPEQAETAFKRYLSLQPLSADGHAALGLLLSQQGRNTEAQPEIERAIKLDPTLLEARKALARVYFSARDFAAAARELEAVLASETALDPELYVMLGTCRFNLRQRDKAMEICERGMQAHPNSEALANFHVSLLLDCSTKRECKAGLIEALKQHPNSPSYLKGVCRLLLQEDPQNQAAQQMFAQLIRVLPEDPEARYLHGRWAYLCNKYRLSIDELKETLAMPDIDDQTKVNSQTVIGMAADELNDPEGAETAFQRALEINRKLASPNPSAALQYAIFLAKYSRHSEAQKIVDEILGWAPSYGPAHFERAKFLAREGQPEKAIQEAELVLEYSADSPSQLQAAHVFLAKTCFALKRVEEAKRHQEWIQAHPRTKN